VHACTIIARNYLAHARVLADSFFEHHPSSSFTVLVVDDTGERALAGEPFEVLSPYDVGLERAEVHRMALIYDMKEFATALKPWLLKHLLRQAEDVTYFDPDIEVFASLDDVSALARERGIVLTPHTLQELPRDELLPSEEMLLRAGIYNLGFIAVARDASPFLDWWADRLARNCIVAVEDGIFVDQRWIDFVPALFEHAILRDPGCNVAYWNLHHRQVAWTARGYEVNGEPLRFYHYSGFTPDRPHLLSTHAGTVPRVLLEDQPDVRRLCQAYARRLRERGFGSVEDRRYRFDNLPSGLPLGRAIRRNVREAMLVAERAGEESVPDPFDPALEDAFLRWLGAPTGRAQRPRYLNAVYRRRGDLRHAFPNVDGADAHSYLTWAETAGRDEDRLLGEVLDHCAVDDGAQPTRGPWLPRPVRRRLAPISARLRRPRPASQHLVTLSSFPPLPGVNVAGYLRAELGVGEAARRLVTGLEAAGIPHATVAYARTESRQEHPYQGAGGVAAFDMNLVCVNADQLPVFRADVGREFFAGHYTIGVWFWEVSRFPDDVRRAFDLVDEIWVASDFVADAVALETSKPVRVVPLPVEAPEPHGLTREDVDLPSEFVFLFSFDFLSIFERKNPLGLIEAFEQAFAPGEGPVLVIKTINGDKDPGSLELLRRRAAKRPDVDVVDGYVSAEERDALMALCDCYVSLHRSEGYGLTMAEAMAAAKPVIATGFSGNVAFMDESNSLLVPYRLASVPPGCEPYPVTAQWADPDLDAAAELMRDVWESPKKARELGRRAQEDVLRRNSPARTAEFVTRRLDEIRTQSERYALLTRKLPTPGAALLQGGRLPTRVARWLLHRLLWPYLVEQQEFAAAVAESLRAQQARSVQRSTPSEAPAPPPVRNGEPFEADLVSAPAERSLHG